MKNRYLASGMALTSLGLLAALPNHVSAQVTQEQFDALKEVVRKQGEAMKQLGDQVQKLQQTHQIDEQQHQQDLQQIQQLRQSLGQAQQKPSVAQEALKATEEAAATEPPMPRVPLDEATVNHNFSILGDAEFQYAKTQHQNGSFLLADFAPIFLYRAADKVLFEAGFDIGLQNDAPASPGASTVLDLSFAQMDYAANDYVTAVAGDMLLPLGTYSERSAGWLNKLPDDPLPRDFLPGSGVGLQLRGAVPVGDQGKLINYAVYGVNGPSSADGTDNAQALDLGGNVGLRSDNAIANLHGHPSGGGRVGVFLPYAPHYDLELGLSGQTGEWDNVGQHLWSAGVADASLHLGPYFETKGEYIHTWYGSGDAGNVQAEGFWVQTAYKLAGLDLELPFINNLELVGRYDTEHDGLGGKTRRWSVGGIYYITNTLLVEGDYEFRHGNDPTQQGDRFILQFSLGF